MKDIAYTGKRLTALFLALALALSLTACGGGEEKKDSPTGAMVYAPESVKFRTPLEKLTAACRSGGNIYLLGTVQEKTGEETASDGVYTYDTFEDRYTLVRLPLEGGEAEELTAYTPGLLPEDVEGELTNAYLRPGLDGTVWVTENLAVQTFDLPEDFDPESGEKWKYISSTGSSQSLVRLDSAGNELSRFDGSGLLDLLEADQIFDVFADDNGNILVNTGEAVVVLDGEGSVKHTIPCPEEGGLVLNRFVRLSDGRIAIPFAERNIDSMTNCLCALDLEAGDWGADRWALPSYGTKVFPGDENALFYCQDGDSLYAWREGGAEGERLLSWIDSSINAEALAFFSFLEDGRLLALTVGSNHSAAASRLAVLTATDAAALPQRTVLTLGGAYIDPSIRAAAADFNNDNTEYYISVRDYTEEQGSRSAAITHLRTEILTGNGPDIICTRFLPVAQCGGQGYLEDLWPYIDSDPDLGREKLMDRVLTTMEHDGKLFHITDRFSLITLTGAESVVGDRLTWTIRDFQEALASMPEGCIALDENWTADAVLRHMLSMSLDRFVDWEAGTSDFTGKEFQNLLEFCKEFPVEIPDSYWNLESYISPPERLYTGRQMLMTDYLYNYEALQKAKFLLGGEVSFIGFPNEEGRPGSCFYPAYGTCLAMSSACQDKEAAWSFMRSMLLPQTVILDPSSPTHCYSYFPINRENFEEMAKLAMTPRLVTKDDGSTKEISRSGEGVRGRDMDLNWDYFATTQEEYDQIMELYNAVDSAYEDVGPLEDIAADIAGAYFAGDRSLEDTCQMIQNRAALYMGEQQ